MARARVPGAAALCVLLLVACGGGGGGGGGGGSSVVIPQSPLTADPAFLSFGSLDPGEEKTVAFSIDNPTAAPITVDTVGLPEGDFTLLSPSLPVQILPGVPVACSLRYRAAQDDAATGALTFQHVAPTGILFIPVQVTLDGQAVTDYGTQGLAGGVTPWLSVEVPADAISLTLEGLMEEDDVIALEDLVGPGGKKYMQGGVGIYVSRNGRQVFTNMLPNTDRPDVQLVSGGGTYQFRLIGTGNLMQVRAIVETRADPQAISGRIDLNVWFAPGLAVDAARAPTSVRLQAVLNQIDVIYFQQGIRIGDIDYYDVGDPTFDKVTLSEFPELLKLSAGAARTRLNIFFVEETLEPGVVGVSPTILGPVRNGTVASGLMVTYEGKGIHFLPASWVGGIAAHEMGHYLGLYHTVEADGTHDFIDDTEDCGVDGCQPPGNLMHWTFRGTDSTILTAGQGWVVRGHPLIEPDTN